MAPMMAPPLIPLPARGHTLRCRTVVAGHFQHLTYIRDVPPQPVQQATAGGLLTDSSAPSASEALLAAFGSCLAMGIHAQAVAQRIAIRSLELHLEADMDGHSGWVPGGSQAGPLGFENVRVSVQLDADAPRAVLAALVSHATLWSPVANTLHNPVHLDVALTDT
jgi:uncharacterized OsmC-like protein